jgi:hypothetical protein
MYSIALVAGVFGLDLFAAPLKGWIEKARAPAREAAIAAAAPAAAIAAPALP